MVVKVKEIEMPKFRIKILTEGQPVRYSYPQEDETSDNIISWLMKPSDARVVSLPLDYPTKSCIVLNSYQLARTIFIVENISEN
jgi:hypothetical protein